MKSFNARVVYPSAMAEIANEKWLNYGPKKYRINHDPRVSEIVFNNQRRESRFRHRRVLIKMD